MTWSNLHKITITLMESGKDELLCEQAMKPYLRYKNERSSSGCTPLHFAALNNDPSTVKVLLNHGALIVANNLPSEYRQKFIGIKPPVF
mmetsp:Transcript_25238/g.32104  ORF Transcript_25238/g.32104 Transcript_25238/m.32104 type:complete len:89 (+) Transcript_25238:91-357(+)